MNLRHREESKLDIGHLCVGPILTVDAGESLVVAARLMGRFSQDVLVVTENQEGIPVAIGLLRERDIVLRAVARPVADLVQAQVRDILPEGGCLIPAELSLKEAIGRMGLTGVRRGVIIDKGGRPLGVASLDQVLSALMSQKRGAIRNTYTLDENQARLNLNA